MRSTKILLTGAALALATGFFFTQSPSPAEARPFAGFLNSSTQISDVAKKTTPSVVNIATSKTVRSVSPYYFDPFFNNPSSPGFGRPDVRKANSLGSGVIVSKDGVILTNNHVVSGADEIRVGLVDGREFKAEVVGKDPHTDVAVLRLKSPPSDLVPIRVGDSDGAEVGDVVLAIGNPFGVGQTVTMGIVSAKGRANVGIVRYEDFIQTDAAINPGNSGGALVNLKGELIGINTAILSRTGGYQGIGLAIPSKMATDIMGSLLKHGKMDRGWLGIGMSEGGKGLGVTVSEVMSGSPASKGGLQKGDRITAVDGESMKGFQMLRHTIANKGADKRITVTVKRNGKTLQLPVTLGSLAETQKQNQRRFRRR